jgi:hypothetical protein
VVRGQRNDPDRGVFRTRIARFLYSAIRRRTNADHQFSAPKVPSPRPRQRLVTLPAL